MATTKKGDTSKATKAPAEKAKVDARKGTSRNTGTAKAGGTARTSPATKPSAKASATIKLTENQVRFLHTIQSAGETGYEPKNKNEQRSIDALSSRKLLKRGTKNKETGNFRYLLTKLGKAQLEG